MRLLTPLCLLLGFLLGESGIGLFDADTVDGLRPFAALAMGWIGLILGENLEIGILHHLSGTLLALSLGHFLAAFFLTGSGCYLVLTLLMGWPVNIAFPFALLAGCLATTSDPMGTGSILCRSGTHSVGAAHRLAQLSTLADVMTALLFWPVASFAVAKIAPGNNTWSVPMAMTLHLLLGAATGTIMTLMLTRRRRQEEVSLLLVGIVLVVSGLALRLSLSPLPICLFASAIAMSLTGAKSAVRDSYHQLELPLYATFLIFCGSLLRPAILAGMALLAAIYVLLRATAKVAGVYAAAKALGLDGRYRLLGLGLISQSGLAVVLALAFSLEARGILGQSAVTLAAAGILLNQLLGALGLRFLIRSGIIPLDPDSQMVQKRQ